MRRVALAFVVMVCTAAPALAAGPSARCQAVQLGRRTLARVELYHFFDRELLRLIRLGLAGRIHLELTLVRRRVAWFDDVVVRVERDVTLTWDDTARRYLIDGVAVESGDLAPLRLDRVPLGRRSRRTAGTHYVEVSARLQIVTASSLLTTARWLTGDNRGSSDSVSTAVARVVAEDLLRKASTSCNVRGR